MYREIYVSKRAFTLVELLVVIAIIALLVSILLPALSKAKEQANQVKCLINQRTFAVGFQMYADDYEDEYWAGQDWALILGAYTKGMKYKRGLQDPDLVKFGLCPSSERNPDGVAGTRPFGWGTARDDWLAALEHHQTRRHLQNPDTGELAYTEGSYEVNGWLTAAWDMNIYGFDPDAAGWSRENRWLKLRELRSSVPISSDSVLWVGYPMSNNNWQDIPDLTGTDVNVGSFPQTWQMARRAINRHARRSVIVSFADAHARKVVVEDLWTLEWHKNYQANYDVILPEE